VTVFLRFEDLKARRIVENWTTLRNRIKKSGFPPGRMIGPNARAWTENEVEAWLDRQPTARKPYRDGAMTR
jgi:hypothetical protein